MNPRVWPTAKVPAPGAPVGEPSEFRIASRTPAVELFASTIDVLCPFIFPDKGKYSIGLYEPDMLYIITDGTDPSVIAAADVTTVYTTGCTIGVVISV